METEKDILISKLTKDINELQKYADKLAEGLPCLPKDVEVLREANANFAQENHKLREAFKYLSDLCESNKDCITAKSDGNPSYWDSIRYWIEEGRNAMRCKWGVHIESCQFCNQNGICTTLEDCPHKTKGTLCH